MRLFNILILVLASLGFASAQSEMGTIIIYRDKALQGAAISFPVEVNSEKVVRIKNGSFFVKQLPAGVYWVSAKGETESKVNVVILPNDTIIVRCGVNTGFWTFRPDLVQVDTRSAKEQFAFKNLKNLSDKKFDLLNRKFALGFQVGSGFGLESIEAFTLDNNKGLYISSGGGLFIGADALHCIHKNFEMAYDVRYQFSSLTPAHKDVDATFSRGVVNVSGYGVIPFKNDIIRLKIGAGAGLYYGGYLNIDGSKANLDVVDLKYKPSLGFRTGIIYETILGGYSYSMSLHYTHVNYQYREAKLNGYSAIPTEKKLATPNGSGIELSMLIHFSL